MPELLVRLLCFTASVTGNVATQPTFKETLAQLWAKLLDFIARFEHPGQAIAANFKYDFVREALIVGVLIALCSSLLGVSLVLKRFSFIGDGLSHVAFGAMTVAAVVNLKSQEMIVVLPVTVLAAVLLLRTGRKRKIAGDASLAMLSVGALGIGYLLINIFGSGNVSSDVCTTLFGAASILGISDFEFWLCIVLSVLVIIAFFFLYNRIFSITFDETFATATGTKAGAYNTIIAIITAVIIVLAMNLVGSLLISALVIFPALSAMRVFKNFRSVVLCSMCVSVFCATAGFLLSIPARTPIGSTIVAVDLLVFLIFSIVGRVKN